MRTIAGTHLIIDAYTLTADVLKPDYIVAAFQRLIGTLKMEQLGEPVIRAVGLRPDLLSTDDDEGGVSVIMPITTSHLSLHGWPLRQAMMLDIFSCHPFDAEVAFRQIARDFQFTRSHHYIVDRVDPSMNAEPLASCVECFSWGAHATD